MSLGEAKHKYQRAHHDLCIDNKHSLEFLELLSDIDTYVALLEETVDNLSDPEESPWG